MSCRETPSLRGEKVEGFPYINLNKDPIINKAPEENALGPFGFKGFSD